MFANVKNKTDFYISEFYFNQVIMKKTFLYGALLVMFLFVGFHTQAQTANVTVNIDLSTDVISINLGADPEVNFVYATAADYANSKTVSKTSHFTVVSNTNYDITVAADNEFDGTDNIPLGVIDINVDPTTANGGELNAVNLSLSPTLLVGSATPSTGAIYNVNYTIADASPLVGLAPEVYTTTITYTATGL